MSNYSLPRAERLRSLTAIRRLFVEGRGGFVYPIRYVVLAEPQAEGVEVLFSVPKKFHKRANKRNLLKRRMREAYRLHAETLRARAQGCGVDLALVYSSKDVVNYKTIEYAVERILGQICERL